MIEVNKISEVDLNTYKLPEVREVVSDSLSSRTNHERVLEHKKALSTIGMINPVEDPLLVNPQRNKFPFCLVWTPIPFLSHIVPCFGHLSIGNYEGLIHDFSSSRYISVNMNSYGTPIMYLQLEIASKDSVEWNNAIRHADAMFKRKEYNLCGTNGFSYCGYILSIFNYKGERYYSDTAVWQMMWRNGVYVSPYHRVKNYLFIVSLAVVVIVVLIVVFTTK